MSDNRIVYGLLKEYGVDTSNLSPKEAWGILKDIKNGKVIPISYRGADYAENMRRDKKREEVRKKVTSFKLPDEQLPRSIGARWINHEIALPDGSSAHFVEGSKLQDKVVFAGKGCRRKIDCVDTLVKQ